MGIESRIDFINRTLSGDGRAEEWFTTDTQREQLRIVADIYRMKGFTVDAKLLPAVREGFSDMIVLNIY